MGVLDFLKPVEPLAHPRLGTLRYGSGHWRGTMALPESSDIVLLLPGGRGGPDPDVLISAERVPEWWARAKANVAKELFEHYSNGKDAGLPAIEGLTSPEAVWRHVRLTSVQVAPFKARNEALVALHTAWDEEHTLGAHLREGSLVELNGSILEAR